ncbi:AAA family ATPase [Methylobacterium sp. A54F]
MLDPDTYDVVEHARGSLEPAEMLRRAPSQSRYSVIAFDDVETEIRKEWTIAGLIGVGELSVWFGAPGEGKSLAIMDAGLHVAAGLPWHDRLTRRGAVLYVAAERPGLVKRRVAAWRKRHGLSGLPFGIVPGRFDFSTAKDDAEEIARIAAEYELTTGYAVALIIIDTKARTMGGGDENSARDMARYVDHVSLIQDQTGAHVAIVDHTPHDAPHRMRGHGALLGAADTTIRVAKAPAGLHTLQVDKVNDGEAVSLAFSVETEIVGHDPVSGQDTTAPIAIPADPPDNGRTKQIVRLSDADTLAHRLLHEAVADVGRDPPASTVIPARVKVVSEDDWRKLCYAKDITASGKQDAKQKAFKRAAQSLQRRGMIGVHEGLVWPVR